MNETAVLRDQLLDLMQRHPPHNWSASLMAAVIATVRVEVAAHKIGDRVSHRPNLRIL